MKKVFLVMAIVGIMVSNVYGEDKKSFCIDTLGPLAEVIMEKRQGGADISAMFAVLTKDNLADSKISKLVNAIIVDAYSVPEYSIQKNKNREIRRFKTKVTIECLKRYAK